MRKKNAPSLEMYRHILLSRTCECITLYGKKDFADVDKLKQQEEEDQQQNISTSE